LVHTNDEKVSFCFENSEDAAQYFESLNWRVQAQQRVYKYAEDEHSSSETRGDGKNKNPIVGPKERQPKNSKISNLIKKKKEKEKVQVEKSTSKKINIVIIL